MKQDEKKMIEDNLDLYKLATQFVRLKSVIKFRFNAAENMTEQRLACLVRSVTSGDFVGSDLDSFPPDHLRNVWDSSTEVISDITFMLDWKFDIFLKLVRLAKNRSMQKYRLHKIVKSWRKKGYQIAFVTLNPDPEFLSKKDSTRRKYISNFLSGCCLDFFANVDFDPKTGREHYHGLCVLDQNNFHKTYKKKSMQHYEFDNFEFGFNDIQFVRSGDDLKMERYTDKLINHAIKSSTGQVRNIIRKRRKRSKVLAPYKNI